MGKSTLFNVLTKSRDALVADYPGLTRDRKYGLCTRYERTCSVIDTGGITHADNELDRGMQEQTDRAVAESHLVLLLVDAQQGLVPEDQVIVDELRRRGIAFVLVVNKIDGADPNMVAADFYQLGAQTLFTIAAKQGRGVEAMMQQLLASLPDDEPDTSLATEPSRTTRIAIIGRPNAGKSTLANALIKQDRLVTSAIPGTTRDSVELPFEYNGQLFTLIDTAGVRRKSRIRETIEKFSIVQTLEAIASAHVVICLVDLTEGLTDQDSTLLDIVLREGRALVLAINKTDCGSHDLYHQLEYSLDTRYRYLSYVEKIRISAQRQIGLKKLMRAVNAANRSAAIDVPTSELNQILEKALAASAPPLVKGRRVKLRYIHQGGSHPPTFVLYGTQADKLPDTYVRYLQNYFRLALKLVGTPIRFLLRAPDNPFAGKRNPLSPRQQRKRERLMRHTKR